MQPRSSRLSKTTICIPNDFNLELIVNHLSVFMLLDIYSQETRVVMYNTSKKTNQSTIDQ